MANTYALHFHDAAGHYLGLLSSFVKLELARKENEPGAMVLTLDPNTDTRLFRIDGRVEVMRRVWGYKPYLEGECYWLIRNYEWGYDQNGEKSLIIEAEDAFSLLKRRICDYQQDDDEVPEWLNSDDLLKALVREQMGSLVADPARDWSAHLAVNADKSAGPLLQLSRNGAARRPLIDVMKEYADMSWANGTRLFYDISGTVESGLRFATYLGSRGVNHGMTSGAPRILSRSANNLLSSRMRMDYSGEATFVYTYGAGVGSGLETYASDPARIAVSPFGRIETVADAPSNLTNPNDVQGYADAALYRARPRRSFEGNYQEVENLLYGVHFGFGDIVVAQMDGVSMDVHVDAVSIVNQGGQDTVNIQCRNEVYIP